jgi:hypothetical protein
MKERCPSQHPAKRVAGLKLERADSSLVTEVSGRMAEYLTCGNRHKKGQMLKYTINYDGMYGSFAKVHMEEKYASESQALPENVKEHFKRSRNHASVYVLITVKAPPKPSGR